MANGNCVGDIQFGTQAGVFLHGPIDSPMRDDQHRPRPFQGFVDPAQCALEKLLVGLGAIRISIASLPILESLSFHFAFPAAPGALRQVIDHLQLAAERLLKKDRGVQSSAQGAGAHRGDLETSYEFTGASCLIQSIAVQRHILSSLGSMLPVPTCLAVTKKEEHGVGEHRGSGPLVT